MRFLQFKTSAGFADIISSQRFYPLAQTLCCHRSASKTARLIRVLDNGGEVIYTVPSSINQHQPNPSAIARRIRRAFKMTF